MPKKPISPKQLAANRANAARSTGPTTPQGKARAAQNARKHGFTASTFAVVRLEDLQEIAHLKDDLLAVYQPVNSQELFALERIALAQQALLRAARLESGLLTTCLNEALDPDGDPINPMTPELVGDGDIEITRAQNRNFALAAGFHRMASQCNSWSLCLRYQAQAELLYRRAVEEFERLRALRPGLGTEATAELPNGPISDLQAEEHTPVAPTETNPFPSAVSQPLVDSTSAPDLAESGLVPNDRGGTLAARVKHCNPPPEQTLECSRAGCRTLLSVAGIGRRGGRISHHRTPALVRLRAP